MTPTATETNDIEALLTIITREDLEGELAQLRAAINVFAKNPKPAIAENAKSLVESLSNKAKRITAHAALAHKTLDKLETACEAKAFARIEQEKQKWTSYAAHLTDQLTTCQRELAAARRTTPHAKPYIEQPVPPQESPPKLTLAQITAIQRTIEQGFPHIKDAISQLIRLHEPPTPELIRQTVPLNRMGIHFSVHNTIYRALYKALLDEREKWRANPRGGLYEHIYNVYRVMMESVLPR